jgi:hypothetical protein
LKKRTKKLLLHWLARRIRPARREENKSFLVLFFKKELLACYADVLISTQVGITAKLRPNCIRFGMKLLLMVFHSVTGGTAQMAAAARSGAAQAEPDLCVRMLTARNATAQDVLAADGYIFATPENLAAIAGMMKDFFDRTYYPVLGRINGRPYAAMICAGSDGENAARQIARIATGWRLREIAAPLIVRTHAQTPEAIAAPKVIPAPQLNACRELGAAMAAGIALGIF